MSSEKTAVPDWMKGANYDLVVADAQRAYGQGNFKRAVELYAEALSMRPDNVDLLEKLASSYLHAGDFENARTLLAKSMEAKPQSAGPHIQLAAMELRLGKLDAAHAAADKAIELEPELMQAKLCKADLYFIQGKRREVYDLLKPLIDPAEPQPMLAMVYAKVAPQFESFEDCVEVIMRGLTDQTMPPVLRSSLLFGLGKVLDDVGRYEDAFAAYDKANKMRRYDFQPARNEHLHDLIISEWTKGRHERLPRSTNESSVPVFIVGMPRSGSTLTEQVLSCMPGVHGGGEIPGFEISARDLLLPDLATGLDGLTPEALTAQADRYLGMIQRLNPEAQRISNKTLRNYLHLGLANLMFPNAKVVWCRRDLRDTCVSCYFQNFVGNHPYAYDLEHLAAYAKDLERLMRHWQQVLGDDVILEFSYEDLVGDLEGASRKLAEHIGCEWDASCLKYYESKRVAVTASNEQIREPIYTKAMGRWKHYEEWIHPLLGSLAT